MANELSDLLISLGNYGSQDQYNNANAYSEKVRVKQAGVQQQAQAKALALGSDDYLRTMVTADLIDSDMSKQEFVQDMTTKDYAYLAQRYGRDVADNRNRYTAMMQQVVREKATDRSISENIIDKSKAIQSQGVGMVGGIVGAALTGYDAINTGLKKAVDYGFGEGTPDPIKFAPRLAARVNQATEAINATKTAKGLQQEAQANLEGQIRSEDRENTYNNSEKGWGDWVGKQLSAVSDTAQMMYENPGYASDVVVGALGSSIGFGVAANVVGKSLAMSTLAKQGMTKAAATNYLASAEGQQLVGQFSRAAVPSLTALTEGGSAINQAQTAILSLPPSEIEKLPEYKKLVEAGMDPNEARMELASMAGNAASISGFTIAFLTGFMNRNFDTNDFASKGVLGSINTARKEFTQEFAQEGSSQFSSNVGQRAVGMDTALDEGVVEAGTIGGIAGGISAGITQVPGTAGRVALGTGKVALAGAKAAVGVGGKAVAKRLDSVDSAIDDESVVGTRATATAAEAAVNATDSVLVPTPTATPSAAADGTTASTPVTDPVQAQPVPPSESFTVAATTPKQSTAPKLAPQDVVKAQLNNAVNLDEADSKYFADQFENLAAVKEKRGSVDRFSAISTLGVVFEAQQDKTDKGATALTMLDNLSELESLESTAMADALKALPADDPMYTNVRKTQEFLGGFQSLPPVEAAKDFVANMTHDDVAEIFDLNILKDPKADPEQVKSVVRAIRLVARYNQSTFNLDEYDVALKQARGLKHGKALVRSLENSKKIAEEFMNMNSRKEAIVAEQTEVIEGLPEDERSKASNKLVSKETVDDDVLTLGNRKTGKGKSLSQHNELVETAALSGKVEAAKAGIAEFGMFVQSQFNKLMAYNESAIEGLGNKKTFARYNGSVMTTKHDDPVWINTKSTNSIALAQMVHAEATMLANSYNAMLENYKDLMGDLDPTNEIDAAILAGPKVVPDLDASITFSRPAKALKRAETKVLTDAQKAAAAELKRRAEAKAKKEAEAKAAAEGEAKRIAEEEAAKKAAEEARLKAEEEVRKAAEAVSNTLLEKFAGLALGAKNLFLKAFTKKAEGSSFLDHPSAMKHFIENHEFKTEDQRKAAEYLLKTVFPKLTDKLNVKLDGLLEQKLRGKAFQDLLDEGAPQSVALDRSMVLNFVRKMDGDTYRFDPRVLEAAFISSVEWLQELHNRNVNITKDEEIAEALGFSKDVHVTRYMRQAVNSGINIQAGVDSLSRRIENLLGVSQNKDTSSTFTQGMMRGLAVNMLELMRESEWIQDNSETSTVTTVTEDGREVSTIYLTIAPVAKYINNNEQLSHRLVRVFSSDPDAFSTFFGSTHGKMRHIGTPPKAEKIGRNQMHSKYGYLSKREMDVINNLQGVGFTLNQPLFDLLGALGKDRYSILIGKKFTDERITNKNDAASIEGKNASIEQALAQIDNYVAAMTEYAAEKGITDLSTVPVYFEWGVSSVGRLQQMGFGTPQGSKVIRELLVATKVNVDLTNENQLNDVWLGVAQALDVSLEKMESHEASIAKAKNIVADEQGLRPAVDAVKSWLKTKSMSDDAKDILFQRIAEATVVDNGERVLLPITDKSIHAVLAVARMEMALEEGGQAAKVFEHSLSIEADGKTDGPIHALVNMLTGEFDYKQIRLMAKGGLFFSGKKISLNDYIQYDKDDLYHDGASNFQENMAKLFGFTLQERPKDLAHGEKVLQVLDGFADFFSYKDGIVEAGRNFVKNPQTVFIYGSGVKGISGKIAANVASNIYKLLSDVAEEVSLGNISSWRNHSKFVENPGLIEALDAVLRTSVDLNINRKDANFGMSKESTLDRLFSNTREGTLTSAEYANLLSGINRYAGKALYDAVDRAVGGLSKNMKLIQRAAQVQSIYFKSVFEDEVKKMTQKRKDEGKLFGKQELSENDITAAYESAMTLAPIYKSKDHDFHITTAERYTSDNTVATTMTGKYRTGINKPTAGKAGVKASVYMVQGTGDGQVILNAYYDDNGEFRVTLPVFDGVEIAAGSFGSVSNLLNKAVYDSWMQADIFGNVSENYDQFLRVMAKADPATLARFEEDLRKSFGKFDDRDSVSKYDYTALGKALRTGSKEQKARKNAKKRMSVWVDHLAGANAPYHSEGEVVEFGKGPSDPDAVVEDYFDDGAMFYDPDAIAAQANIFYKEELAKLEEKEATQASKPIVQRRSRFLLEAVKKVGKEVVTGKVWSVKGSDLTNYMQREKGLSADQEKLFWDLLEKDGAYKDYDFFFGSSEELTKYRNDVIGLAGDPIQNGEMNAKYEVAFVANVAPETLLHEMLHTHTFKRLVNYYKGKQLGIITEPYVADAIVRLENLMGMFREMDFSNDPENIRGAAVTLQLELDLNEGKPAQQMSEFISWMLTNQNLIQVGKKTRVYSPLMKIIGKALNALKELIGIKTGPGLTMFSNVRFNTEVLMTAPDMFMERTEDSEYDAALTQVFGHDERISEIERRYTGKLNQYLAQSRKMLTPLEYLKLEVKADNKLVEGKQAAENMVNAGYALNPREMIAFQSVYQTMQMGLKLNTATMARVSELYSKAVRAMPDAGFLTRAGRLDDLSSFVALSQVSQDFRDYLKNLDGIKDLVKKEEASFDSLLKGIANSIINMLTHYSITRKGLGKSALEQMDILSKSLSELKKEQRNLVGKTLLAGIETSNNFGAKYIKQGSEKATEFLRNKRAKQTNGFSKLSLDAAGLVASLGSKKEMDSKGATLTTMLNHTENWIPAKDFVRELRGMTNTNENLHVLNKKIKSMTESLRQAYRENVPKELSKGFSKPLTKKQWTDLSSIAEIDLVGIGQKETHEILRDLSQLPNKIKEQEAILDSVSGRFSKKQKVKAKALAHYMVTGENTSRSLLRNATSIANLFNEPEAGSVKATPEMVKAVSRLISFYALDGLDNGVKKTLTDLSNTEKEGMSTLVGYLYTTRAMEIDKADGAQKNLNGLYNGWKGHIPFTGQDGFSQIIADDKKSKELIRTGYVRVGDYVGDPREGYQGKRGIYQTSVSQNSKYTQTTARIIHSTYNGVDLRTGQSRNGKTQGMVVGAKARQITANRSGNQDNLPPGDYLLPVLDDKGNVFGYDIPLPAEKIRNAPKDKNLARSLGIWSGRILEESQSDDYNRELLGIMKETLRKKAGDTSEFVNIADPKLKDKVFKDAWDTLGWQIKKDAAEVFGKPNYFPVLRDQVDLVVGYHSASVKDPWTGVSRWSPEAQKRMRDAATVIMGKRAFEILSKGEETLQYLVSYSKVSMIIRSVFVSAANIASNQLHLIASGLGPIEAATGQRDAFIATTAYMKNQDRILALTVEYAGTVTSNPNKAKRIKAEITALETVNKNSPIYALRSELSTISEGLTEADQDLYSGDWATWFEGKVDKMLGSKSSGFKTVGKNLLITKDTAVYQGLNRAVQLGDFVSKVALYRHLTEKKGMDPEEAHKKIMTEFVNYDLPAGRWGEGLEAIGARWFWNYKMRIMKVMMTMARERPASALLFGGIVGPELGVDSVFSGSLAGNIYDGSIGYSLGIGMGIDGLSSNPYWNLVD